MEKKEKTIQEAIGDDPIKKKIDKKLDFYDNRDLGTDKSGRRFPENGESFKESIKNNLQDEFELDKVRGEAAIRDKVIELENTSLGIEVI